jgi:hypothetical protein
MYLLAYVSVLLIQAHVKVTKRTDDDDDDSDDAEDDDDEIMTM